MPIRLSQLGLTCGAAAAIAGGAWLLRPHLAAWTHGQIAGRYQAQLAALPERSAARLLAQLASADDTGIEVLAATWTDSRPAVAAAAVRETLRLVERWSQLPPGDAAPHVARLVKALAQAAPQMAAAEREAAAALAERLLEWPVDSKQVPAAQFIADCDALLRLPPAIPAELRLASVPVVSPAPVQEASADPPPQPMPAVTVPPTLQSVPAAPAGEPQRLLAPKAKAMQISDD
jgi:hypothetical protein